MNVANWLHARALQTPAAPALFYGDYAVPFDPAHRNLHAYRERLLARPGYARALKEAEPYFHYFPMDNKPSLAKEVA